MDVQQFQAQCHLCQNQNNGVYPFDPQLKKEPNLKRPGLVGDREGSKVQHHVTALDLTHKDFIASFIHIGDTNAELKRYPLKNKRQ